MHRPQPTIRRKLILSISIPLLVTYLGLLAWDYYRQRSLTVEQMQQTVLERAEGTAARLDTRLTGAMHVADSLVALMESPVSRNERQIRLALAGAVRMPWVTSANITFEAGEGSEFKSFTRHRGIGTLLANRDRVVIDATSTGWHERVKQSRAAGWTETYQEPGGERGAARRACTYVVPILAENAVVGSASVTVDLRALRRLRGGPGGPDGPPPGPPLGPIASALVAGRADRSAATMPAGAAAPSELEGPRPLSPGPPPDDIRRDAGRAGGEELEDFAVFDSTGRLVIAPSSDEANPPKENLFETALRLGQPEMADAATMAMKGASQVVRVAGLKQVIPSVPEDTHHWLAMTPISATGWLLVTAVPESANLAPVLQRLWGRAAFLAGGLVVLLLVVMGVSVGISRPIERLAAAVDQVAAGDLSAEVRDVNSRDELGRLAVGFNNMTRRLQQQIVDLTEQSAAREKVESELRIARQIQNDLLPRAFPDHQQFALHAVNLPALYVAGDFYDFFFTPQGLLNLVIADVSGKGVPAALVMAVTRTVVRNLALAGQSPLEIARSTNRTLLADTSASMFVTMLLCQYDPSTGRLTYVNAGHPPAIRLRLGSEPAPVCTLQSPLLGVAADGLLGPFEQGEETLEPGDTLFLYTDGVSETVGPDGRLLGTAGVAHSLCACAHASPDAICRQTSDRLDQLCNGRRQDDVTMLALRRLGARA